MAIGPILNPPQYTSHIEVINYRPDLRSPLRGVIVIEGKICLSGDENVIGRSTTAHQASSTLQISPHTQSAILDRQ